MKRIMKRLIMFVLALLLVLPLAACGNGASPEGESGGTEQSTPAGQGTDDGVLKVLMIGNSFSYYYVDELYGLLKNAGIDAVVANVYHSGCSLSEHVGAYNGEKDILYDYCVTDSSGRLESLDVNLEHCLNADDWDVISIQQHFYPSLTETYQRALASCTPYAEELVGIIRQYEPNAKILWHQTWAYQVGYDRGDPVATVDVQARQYETIRDVSHTLSEELSLPIVPSGDAWQIARADPLIGDTLCVDSTRPKENPGAGDYYHDGNVGGGQYLNACTWFEILTGKSPVGNLFYPDYAITREQMKALQNAAHQAVQELGDQYK